MLAQSEVALSRKIKELKSKVLKPKGQLIIKKQRRRVQIGEIEGNLDSCS